MTLVGSTYAQAEILIATAGPFTGQNIFRGEQIQQGAEMAVADINADGGVLGQRVELTLADDACDPDQAVAVAKKLVSDGVVFVAGHVCSHSSIPASKVYEQAGVLMISPASTNPRLTDEGGDNVFRVCGRDDQQGMVSGDYLADEWGGKKIAILHDSSTYGKGLADETRKQLNKRGVKAAMYEAYAPGERDYSELVSRLHAANIDVVYIGGYSSEAGLIVRQARDRGYGAQVVSVTRGSSPPGIRYIPMRPSGYGARQSRRPVRWTLRRWSNRFGATRSRPCWARSTSTTMATSQPRVTFGMSGTTENMCRLNRGRVRPPVACLC
jgi:ABC-type branched-subunit amino acid transport system substrate-binding protein